MGVPPIMPLHWNLSNRVAKYDEVIRELPA
jgi:hypothetical protein